MQVHRKSLMTKNPQLCFTYLYVYQAADTMAYPLLAQMTKFTVRLIYSHCSNNTNISTVVMLGFWWCQFNKGILAWGLCLSW